MIRSLLTMALAFGLFGQAHAQGLRVLEQVEMPYELTLDQIRLPTVVGGSITVHACEDCGYVSHSTAATTRFIVNGKELELADFLTAIADLRKAAGHDQAIFVGVFVDKASQRVNRITAFRTRG